MHDLILKSKDYIFYASNKKQYTSFGPCTPVTSVFSISAVLLGPVANEIEDGKLLPHLEIGQHPIKKNTTYDNYIGQKAFESKGRAHWNERLAKVISILKTTFNYDRLYISGGNAKNIDFKLDDNIIIANNRDGIKGGAMLWK